MTRLSFILRVFYASAFVYASIGNWAAFIELFPTPVWRMPDLPLLSAVYFYFLLVIDPVVSALLLLRPKIGVVLAGLIVTTNIAHNTWIFRRMNVSPDFDYWLVVAFLLFYFLTVYPVWRGLNRNELSPDRPNQSLQPPAPSGRG